MSYTNYNHDFRRNRICEPSQLYANSDLFHSTSDQKYMLGCIFDLNDGRRFRYCENGDTILYKALMAQSSAPVSGQREIANASGIAAAVGNTSITITITTTCSTDDFKNGWLVCMAETAAILGDMYLIKSNTSGTTPVLQLADTGGVRIAIPITTELTVIKNKYKDLLVVPKTPASGGAVVGVPLVDIPVDYFFWAQTKGPCPLIVDTDTIVPGDQIGETDDANVNGGAGTHAVTYPIWGTSMSKPTNTQTDQPAIVDLNLE